MQSMLWPIFSQALSPGLQGLQQQLGDVRGRQGGQRLSIGLLEAEPEMAQKVENGDRQGEAAKPAQVIRLVLLVRRGWLAGRAAHERRRHVLRLALAVTHNSPPPLRMIPAPAKPCASLAWPELFYAQYSLRQEEA